MRIRTRFILSSTIFGVILVAIIVLLVFTNISLYRANEAHRLVNELQQESNELGFLISDYLMYQEAQQPGRVEARLRSVNELIQSFHDLSPLQQALLADIETSHQRLTTIFSEFNAILDGTPTPVGMDYIQISWSRMMVQSRAINANILQLENSLSQDFLRLEQTNTGIITSLTLIFGTFIIFSFYLSSRRIITSLAGLQKGAGIIGSGNLDFQIETGTQDEIGELAGAFNRMTAALKTVTASKQDLEREVFERKKSEDALKDSEEKYRGLFESMSEACALGQVIFDENGKAKDFRYVEVNAAFSRLIGIPIEQIRGRTALEIVPNIEPFWIETFGEVARTGKPVHFERYGTVSHRWRDVHGYSPRPGYFFEINIDITRRKKYEEELLQYRSQLEKMVEQKTRQLIESEQRFRQVAESTPDFIYTFDRQLRLTAVNAAMCRAFNKTAAELIGRSHGELGAPESVSRQWREMSRRALETGKTIDAETTALMPDGGQHTYQHIISPIRDSSGEITGLSAISRDTTRRRQLEEELHALSNRIIQLQEEERANISRELHDEVGQSLTVLGLMLARLGAAPGEIQGATLEEARGLVKEISSQLRNLSTQLHPTMLEKLGLLPSLMGSFNDFTQRTGIAIDFKQHGLDNRTLAPQVSLAAYRIVQEALTNIARHSGIKEAKVRLTSSGGRLNIEIQDNGKGFDPAQIRLDSSGIRGMIERTRALQGTFEVKSIPGQGTAIFASLPLGIETEDLKETA